MRLIPEPVGTLYKTRIESDISELSLGATGLRIVVDTKPHKSDEPLLVEYHFEVPRGFRFLDEGDLLRYWASNVFTPGYHLFEIKSGGGLEQEELLPGMLSVTLAVGTFREWFVCTTGGCVNVLSVNPPLVRVFK